jgi:hypothetical protein
MFTVLDWLISPLGLLSSILMRLIRRTGVSRLKLSKRVFNMVGVFPIRDHYYEPLFNPAHLKHPLNQERSLRSIEWNINTQVEMLTSFNFSNELK